MGDGVPRDQVLGSGWFQFAEDDADAIALVSNMTDWEIERSHLLAKCLHADHRVDAQVSCETDWLEQRRPRDEFHKSLRIGDAVTVEQRTLFRNLKLYGKPDLRDKDVRKADGANATIIGGPLLAEDGLVWWNISIGDTTGWITANWIVPLLPR